MSKTICKFHCDRVEHLADTGSAQIHLHAVYEGSPENDAFFEATPGGDISLGVVNPEGAKVFEAGQDYYVTFEKAEK